MTNIQKLSVELTAELVETLNAAVDSGDYTSPSEVIREALRDWKLRRMVDPLDVEELRALWDEGIASGPGRFSTIDEIREEIRKRTKASARV